MNRAVGRSGWWVCVAFWMVAAGCQSAPVESPHAAAPTATVAPAPVRPAVIHPAPAPTATATWVKVELYFGLARKGKMAISAREWGQFLHDVVTPRFPEGLTVLDGLGQWEDETGKVEAEDAKILVLVFRTSPERDRSVEEIRAAYKQWFEQTSVLRVTTAAQVGF